MKRLVIILIMILFVASFVFAVEDINNPYSVDNNTIALWHFNEGSGNTVYDETDNDNDGTIDGATWMNGKYGDGLSFDGENDIVSVPYQDILIPEQHLTLEAWVNRNSSADGMIISKNGPYFLAVRDNKVVGGIYADWTEVHGQTELELNTWYHIAMTYDGQNVKVYVNGIEDGSAEHSGNIAVTNQALHFGWGEPGHNQYFNGIIDEIRISDITRIFNETNEEEPTLEEQIQELRNRNEYLEEQNSLLQIALDEIQNSFDDFVAKIERYVSVLGIGAKKKMICNYMTENNLIRVNYTDLGLTCFKRFVGSCKCV